MFPDPAQQREAIVDQLDTLWQDLRLIARSLVRQKAWTAVAVATLALGIGANSTLFTIINAVLIRPLPYPQSDRIVSISESDKGVDAVAVPSPVFVEWRRASRSFASLAVYGSASTIVKGSGDAETVSGMEATSAYFAVLGVAPAAGRTFSADEARPGAPKVVVLSDQLWRRAFGGDPAILGKSVSFDGTPYSVIGIMPPSFTNARRALYWTPLDMSADPGVTFYYQVVGRLRAGTSIAAARAELTRVSKAFDSERAVRDRGVVPVVMTLHERRYGDTRTALLVLLAAVGVLLLIACTNVANLLLVRAARRQREFAVRVALGATRGRLVRYLLSESLILALLGGVFGLLIPVLSTSYFVRIGPATLGRADGVQIDWSVVAFTFAVAVGTGLLFGLAPAIGIGRTDVSKALTATGTRGTNTRGQNRLRGILVVGELATALVLLTGAGVLMRSFTRVMSIGAGIRPERILLAKFELSYVRYGKGQAAATYFNQVLDRVRAMPQVASVALADAPPLAGARQSFSTTDVVTGKTTPRIDVASVGNGYFDALGVRLRAGRVFSNEDRQTSARVAVINEALARVMFPAGSPVGQTINKGGRHEALVVGVVQDVKQRGVEAAALPTLYVPVQQGEISPYMTLVVKTTGDPSAVVSPIRDVARDLDATQPVPTFSTMEQAMLDAVAPRRFSFILLGLFASLAAVLAAIGLYGVLSYVVAERTNELGIRVALGADRTRLIGLVIGEGMRLTIVGIVIGLGVSLAAVRMLQRLVFEVSVYDPWTFVAGAGLMVGIALIACYVPARRATRVDPMVALRSD